MRADGRSGDDNAPASNRSGRPSILHPAALKIDRRRFSLAAPSADNSMRRN